jgi:hypothetical protein
MLLSVSWTIVAEELVEETNREERSAQWRR